MSTEHQQYSPENQAEVIARYAKSQGMIIVNTYADHGRSGLNLAGRDGLRRLLRDVETGNADFSSVLVYDISRWGRFQDADESAYYEYVLKRAGILVHYCAEPFENDGSLSSALLKTVKRTMAGEYSRELSVKVFAGQCRLIELGFRQGGPAGFGLRRQLIDREGREKGILSPGERKSLQTDRVILVPGPPHEIAVILEIFDRFTRLGQTESDIAANLNGRNILSARNKEWTRATVHQVLTNPKYVGNNVYNRRSFKLKRKRVVNPPDMWITREGAFASTVTPEQFARARAIIDARHLHLSDEQLLERLRSLLLRLGKLSGLLIDETDDMPSSSLYASRFGGLHRAYQLIGWNANRDFSYVEINRTLRSQHSRLVEDAIAQLRINGTEVSQDATSGLLTLNGEFTASLVLARCYEGKANSPRWHIRFDAGLLPDITIAMRLGPGNKSVLDYYLLPSVDVLWEKLRLAPDNGVVLDLYRFENLNFFMRLAQRTKVESVA
jgi:DNA invertase Pin-like site-specific DNA recombinase